MSRDASIENLRRVQGQLTVALIMVPRDKLLTCSPEDTAWDTAAQNTNMYSYLPVLDRCRQVIGLYDASRWFSRPASASPIGEDFLRLSEDIVIGADASIFDFIQQADTHPTNLVISGNRVAGLVSLFDIQQLPVRAAIFALVTSFEMALALAIECRWPSPEDWLAMLSEGRQEKLKAEIEKSRRSDTFVSAIAFTQFADKADLVRKAGMLEGISCSLKVDLADIQSLRDNIAHANSYADTPEGLDLRACLDRCPQSGHLHPPRQSCAGSRGIGEPDRQGRSLDRLPALPRPGGLPMAPNGRSRSPDARRVQRGCLGLYAALR